MNVDLKKIEQCGMVGASTDMILAVLDLEINKQQFEQFISDPKNAISIAYKRGLYKYEFQVQLELSKKAMAGDTKAFELLEDIKRKSKFKK
jgi:hypothetical protein